MNVLARFGLCFFLGTLCVSFTVTHYSTVVDVQSFIKENPDSVILFQRHGCPYCAYVRPLFEGVRKYFGDQTDAVSFLSIEVSGDVYNLKNIFNLLTVPTFMYIKDGVEQAQYRHGSKSKQLKQSDIEAIIQKLYL